MTEKIEQWNIYPSTEEGNAWIESQIDEFNGSQLDLTGKQIEVPKNYMIKEGDTIIGGIKSCVYLEEILHVSVLFVAENYRYKGLGSALLKQVENEAKAIGARLVRLDTYDFQAKDFYLKHGYEIFGILEDCPKGHQRYFLKKNL